MANNGLAEPSDAREREWRSRGITYSHHTAPFPPRDRGRSIDGEDRQMQHRHVRPLSQGGITVITVAKNTLAAINESTCFSGPTPLVGEFLDEFVQVMEASPGPVVVDIRDTHDLDHASVSMLFRLARLVADHNKGGRICCSSEVKEILDLSRLNTICPTAAKLEEAIAELAD